MIHNHMKMRSSSVGCGNIQYDSTVCTVELCANTATLWSKTESTSFKPAVNDKELLVLLRPGLDLQYK